MKYSPKLDIKHVPLAEYCFKKKNRQKDIIIIIIIIIIIFIEGAQLAKAVFSGALIFG